MESYRKFMTMAPRQGESHLPEVQLARDSYVSHITDAYVAKLETDYACEVSRSSLPDAWYRVPLFDGIGIRLLHLAFLQPLRFALLTAKHMNV